MRQLRAGFSLLEVIIATSLSVILLMGFFQLLSVQGRIASEEVQDTDAQTAVIRAMTNILPLLQEARATPAYVQGPPVVSNTFQFRVPIKDLYGKLEFREDKKTVTQSIYMFGAGTPGSMIMGHYYEIDFLPGVVGSVGRQDERLSEATILNDDGSLGTDLNLDGDMVDTFVFGTLMLRERTSTNALIDERQLGGRICIEEGKASIFQYEAMQLKITLMYADIRNKQGEYSRLRKTETIVHLRNGEPDKILDPEYPLNFY